MNDIELKKLKSFWLEEETYSFKGWDFSHLDGRWSCEETPWNYKDLVLKYLEPEAELLDMGTGGREFLLELKHSHEKTSVTEAWATNIEVCKEVLSPLGIRVYEVEEDSALPIGNELFDIVINRHEAYDLEEVSRILKKDGLFITQQVGCEDCYSLAKHVDKNYISAFTGFNLSRELNDFVQNGFEIIYSDESFMKLTFYDIGVVVYFMKIIEWTFPNFSVDRNIDELLELQKL